MKLSLDRVMAIKRMATLLAAILVVSGGNTQAFAYRKLQDEQSWPPSNALAHLNGRRWGEVEMTQGTASEEPSSVTLPNGADAVKETYGDWAVECRIAQNARECSVGQYQFDQQQRLLMFSIEITQPKNGDYAAIITMPFGLNLPDGIRLRLGDQPVEQLAAFATCLPTGCLAPFKFSTSSIETMKTTKILTVSAKAYAGGKDTSFNVSLKGFPAAIERLKNLQ